MATLPIIAVSNQQTPPGCIAKIVPYIAQTASATNDAVDITFLITQGKIDQIQGLYIDNADNGAPIIITLEGTNQRIFCRKNAQGWFPVLTPEGQCKASIYSNGGVAVPLFFINVPMPAAVWDV